MQTQLLDEHVPFPGVVTSEGAWGTTSIDYGSQWNTFDDRRWWPLNEGEFRAAQDAVGQLSDTNNHGDNVPDFLLTVRQRVGYLLQVLNGDVATYIQEARNAPRLPREPDLKKLAKNVGQQTIRHAENLIRRIDDILPESGATHNELSIESHTV